MLFVGKDYGVWDGGCVTKMDSYINEVLCDMWRDPKVFGAEGEWWLVGRPPPANSIGTELKH